MLNTNQIKEIRFHNGLMAVDTEKLPVPVKAVKRSAHGDWKTQSVRDPFMGLEEGEVAHLIEIWHNFEGRWCRVKRYDGKISDVRSSDLDLIINS